MSMLCTLSRVTAAQMKAMREDSGIADQLLREPLPAAPARTGLFARLFGKPVPAPVRTVAWIGAAEQYELEHQWHILHFLLTGQAEGGPFPASFLCGPGEEIGSDSGYGRPRLFDSAQAGRIAAHLATLDEATLLRRYDAAEINRQGIYWLAEEDADEEAARDEVRGLHQTVREVAAFAGDAAARGSGLVVEIY